MKKRKGQRRGPNTNPYHFNVHCTPFISCTPNNFRKPFQSVCLFLMEHTPETKTKIFFIAFIIESSYWALEKLQNNQNELEINTIHTINHSLLSNISKVKPFHYFSSTLYTYTYNTSYTLWYISSTLKWNNLRKLQRRVVQR